MIWDSSAYKAIHDAIKRGATEQVKQQLSKYFNTMNHRIQRLEKAGLTNTPAYMAVQKSGGRFRIRGKSLSELSKEFARAQSFEKAKTSQVSQARSYIEKQASAFSETIKSKVNANSYDVFKTAVNMLKERADVQNALMRYESMNTEGVKYLIEKMAWQQFINDTESETEREADYIMQYLSYEDIEERVNRYADEMTAQIEEMIEERAHAIAESLSGIGGF